MRELKRSMARANMRDAGFTQINKPKGEDRRSLFSRYWRKCVHYVPKK